MSPLLFVSAIVTLFILIIGARTALFVPVPQSRAEVSPAHPFDRTRVAESLSRMIRIPTVSSRLPEDTDQVVFETFRSLLAELYPAIHRECECVRIGAQGVLYRWKGRSPESPTVLMSHYDVVPADETGWTHPAFSGHIDSEGIIWGRGAIDTKVTLCGIMESVEVRIQAGFVPERDVYLSFAGDEEVFGTSAREIVDYMAAKGISPSLVLDEGGAVVERIFPGVTKPCAVIGIAEKGMLDVELSVESGGGHASAPPARQGVGRLARALSRIETSPFKSRLTPAVKAMFDALGRHSSMGYRILFANLWCFKPALDLLCRLAGGELNALMRTTACFTMLKGSSAFNVIPSVASATVNVRLLPGDTAQGVIDHFKKRAGPKVAVTLQYATETSGTASIKSEGWGKVRDAVSAVWPAAVVAPYLMVACTDSRHFSRICPTVLKFSAMELTKEERSSMHGRNERIPADKLVKACEFFWRLEGAL